EPARASALDPTAPLAASALSIGHGLYVELLKLSSGPFTPDADVVASFDWSARAAQKAPMAPEIAVRSPVGQIVGLTRRTDNAQLYRLDPLRAGERVRERLVVPLRAITDPGA